MKPLITPLALAAAVLLGACASSPTAPASLVTARAAVRAAETDPVVLSGAPLELKKATDSLRRAEAVSAKGESLAEIDSAALVATRQAETAVAVANAKRNEEQIKTAEVDRERARADQRAREALAAKTDAQNAKLDAQAAKLETSVAKAQADDAQARALAAQQAAATAQQQLQSLQARQTERGLLVTLGDVLFEFGRAEIKPAAQEALNQLAQYLASQPDKHVVIEGYTDSVGSNAANQALSQRRADAVAQALARRGIASSRLISNGLGEANPVADNSTDTNRALNRRVEIYIS